jgi:hypothetical protein
LGDKDYAGLYEYRVDIPAKRIKIEQVFAYMKNFRILQRLNHYSIAKINIFFQSIANIYNFYKS